MARDPATTHSDDALRDALRDLAQGDGHLPVGDPLRAELLHLGLARIDAVGDTIHVTPDGRRFIANAPREELQRRGSG